jgi:hypothetical protein
MATKKLALKKEDHDFWTLLGTFKKATSNPED